MAVIGADDGRVTVQRPRDCGHAPLDCGHVPFVMKIITLSADEMNER